MNKLKVMSVFGTRPEAIKMAPLALELRRRESIESLICVTAQHREMLDSVMNCFGLTADADLNIMGKNQTLTDVTVKALKGLEGCFAEFEPDLVLVHGDTSTTFSAALAAFYAKIPVGHVEAGLRTYDRYSPFPEEMNRCLVGRLALRADVEKCRKPPRRGRHRRHFRHRQHRHRRDAIHRRRRRLYIARA